MSDKKSVADKVKQAVVGVGAAVVAGVTAVTGVTNPPDATKQLNQTVQQQASERKRQLKDAIRRQNEPKTGQG